MCRVCELLVAGSSFLVLNDDIASILDDVAVMSKVAVKITAGVLGDDLTLNALQVAAMTNNITQPAFLRIRVLVLQRKRVGSHGKSFSSWHSNVGTRRLWTS